ncbi:MAG: hydantoinase B/oxoprolinase family protein, partial [Acidimicrobiales bacterium]
RNPCPGHAGGDAGGAGRVSLTVDDAAREVDGVLVEQALGAGGTVTVTAAGGGGWGTSMERPAELVLRDVASGLVSIEAARSDYGVVIDAEHLTVDERATEALRAADDRGAHAPQAVDGGRR